ncbi:MAG: pentapeptide repeat-containing protein [Cyanobacteria bacterium P01_A01_bin.123]
MNRSPNLQNRSFRGQDLTGADFSGANLRGCDFQGAILRGANFQGVALGRSRRQWLGLILAIAIAVLLTGHAVTRLIFAVLGQSILGRFGVLVIVLYGVLMATGLGILARPRSPRLAMGLSSSLSGALLGFFYVGNSFDEALMPAGLGAIVGAAVAYGLNRLWPRSGWSVGLITASVVMCSGAVFLLGTTAIAGIAGHHWVGVLFSGLTLGYLMLTWRWSLCLGEGIDTFGGTSFRNADLTGMMFEPSQAGRVCFLGAIEPPT